MSQAPVIAFLSNDAVWQSYQTVLTQALARHGITPKLQHGASAPEAVDYIVYAPFGQPVDFAPFTRAKAVLSLWAGVETIISNESLTQPLCRMVDPSLEAGMVEYVLGHVMRHHLGMDTFLHGQDGIWRHDLPAPPLAAERRVGILGLGALGRACAQKLRLLGFDLYGWSRSPQLLDGVSCQSGESGLNAVLENSEILVTLLPLTAQTSHILNAERLAKLPKGAVVINPGRGKLIDDTALLEALDRGHLAHATLDVFAIEPLPADHAYWAHPKVTVTPHIAAATREGTAAEVVAENIRRGEAGLDFLHQVDREAGY